MPQTTSISLRVPLSAFPRDGYVGPGWRTTIECWPEGPRGLSYLIGVLVTGVERSGDEVRTHFVQVPLESVVKMGLGERCRWPR